MKNKKVPMRKCVGCQEMKNKKEMIRIVRTEEGDFSLAATGKKKFRNMCEFYEVPIYFYKDKDTLGHAMGKEMRASLAVLDEGLAKGILKHIKAEESQTV